jgi:hypothetical protein
MLIFEASFLSHKDTLQNPQLQYWHDLGALKHAGNLAYKSLKFSD